MVKLFRSYGVNGWRRGTALKGKPDFVFAREHSVVFVDGCFWHGCECKRLPNTNRSFWEKKIADNRFRDRKVTRILRSEGWNVIRIWEHQLKKDPEKMVRTIARQLGRTLFLSL
jgi:DNA mismatch endonuclease (patch repair protein)